jgi:hypothetical protein
VLGVIAIALGATVATIIVRAIVGYSITPFAFNDSVQVTVHDRSVALWMTPESSGANCIAINNETQQQAAHRGSADRVTVTDDGHSWLRLGLISGPPGSTYTVSCSSYGRAPDPKLVGYADNPRISRYVWIGVVGGGIAALSAVRRSNARRASTT